MAYAGKVLMLLANHWFTKDVRVKQEAELLAKNNWKVSVISMGDSCEKKYEVVKGISVYRFPALPGVQSIFGYFYEYLYTTVSCFVLSIFVLIKHGFNVIHAHNPPDTLVLIGLFYKLLGKKFIFDHHDLTPELFLSRIGRKSSLIYRVLVMLEKLSCKLSDYVFATNESYRKIEIKRSNISPDKIRIVRNGPDPSRIYFVESDNKLRQSDMIILGYVGAINPQDGVDYLLRALKYLLNDLKKDNFYCIIIGRGDALIDLKKLAMELNINDKINFTGYISDNEMRKYLSAADICISPDPASPLNNVSTWTKIMEYMALGKPIVSFDLPESRFSAQNAALYAKPNDERDFAKKIVLLMDNPKLRKKMGEFGRKRVEKELAWEYVSKPLLQAYNSLRTR